MAMTASDLTFVRAMIGDNDSADQDMSDDELNTIYDHADYGNGDLNKTIAWALRQMCMKLRRKVAKTNNSTGDTVQQQQEREAVCEQADEWEIRAGIGLSKVTTGSINLGIDEEDQDLDIE